MTDGTTTWTYTYDANGMRTSRTNGTKTYNYVYNGSQLTQMTVGNDTLYFTYGVFGPTTVTWNGETYYYALNGQGDVTGIFDEEGTLVVIYNWDNAWGYNPQPEGSLASTLGTLNPLRYRGYVYDQETGYYYLQSRYYDPEIGRFINADAFTSTGQGLLGNNMFAYCLNNPVCRYDPSGGFSCFMYTTGDENPFSVHSMCMGIGGGGAGAGGGLVGKAIIQREIDYLTNTDPKVVFEAEYLAFYHGVPVIKVDFGDGHGGGLSFGIIILDDDYENNADGIQALNHEYGHIIHLRQVGLPVYALTTAIPSLISAGLTKIFPEVWDVYFSLPWERVADYLGGVDRGYLPGANTVGSIFWFYTLVASRGAYLGGYYATSH